MEKKLTTAAGAPVPDNQEQNLSTETNCGIGRRSQTLGGWGPDECGLVAESAEPEDPAPALPPIRSYGQGDARASTWMP